MAITLEDARRLFDRRRAAWLAEDLEAYVRCFADDVVLEVPGRTVRGHEEYEPMSRRSFEWARPLSFEFHNLTVGEGDGEGDVVMADWTITVERRSDGVPVTWRGMSVCGIVDDRIAWWREYYEDPVGLGKDNGTPTGTFVIRVRQKDPTWWRTGEPAIPPKDPRNILGTRWLGFQETQDLAGFGIHGTEDPGTIGKESSAGCVRLRNQDIEVLYDFVSYGTEVVIQI
jgi:ketosteroid isomerase-like protein